jgi:inner membrane protein
MDNLTHTLIGTLVGEVAARVAPADKSSLPAPLRRNLCVTLAAIGSNLPDSDLLYSFFGAKVNYLLHHRGHTHTVLIALLLGSMVFGITLWWLKRRGHQPSRQDRLLLTGILLFTPLLHIAMDFSNNYGVHPFWPLDNRWFYGDSVFIIEPLFWAACAPLAFIFRSIVARIAMFIVMAIAIGLMFFSGMAPISIAVIYSSIVAAMLFIGWRAPANIALASGVTLWLGATLMFVIAADVARSRIDEAVARQFPNSKLIDAIVTPMPSNPVCWDVITVGREDDDVVLLRAKLSLAPSLLAAKECPSRSLGAKVTAPSTPVTVDSNDSLQWYSQVSTPLDQLVAIARTNCEASAALRFIRAPWMATVDDQRVLGDLRYDLEEGFGFAEVVVSGEQKCPPFVPPWTPPRKDLLEEPSPQPSP